MLAADGILVLSFLSAIKSSTTIIYSVLFDIYRRYIAIVDTVNFWQMRKITLAIVKVFKCKHMSFFYIVNSHDVYFCLSKVARNVIANLVGNQSKACCTSLSKYWNKVCYSRCSMYTLRNIVATWTSRCFHRLVYNNLCM